MKKHEVVDTYDEGYAATYNERFLLNERQVGTDHEIEIIRQLLVPDRRWLDVGCGTGYFLSRFPGVPRAGLDLAPAMLNLARKANPDALFFREGDFMDDLPEWHGQWALVTCMWWAYCLVESMSEIERLIKNLAHWTSDTGACFISLCDPVSLAPDVHLPYRMVDPFHGGVKMITGVIWSWVEESGKQHQNMVTPQIEHMVNLFKEWFDVVDVVEYPLFKPGRFPQRKGIIAKVKKRA